MPPAARNLFEKRFLDLQKLFISALLELTDDNKTRQWIQVEKKEVKNSQKSCIIVPP
jgi:hypothetical protein